MSTLRQAAEDYLAIRRSPGFQLAAEGYLLHSFVGYAEQAGASRLTVGLAMDWAELPPGKDPVWCGKRLAVVRGFARHLQTLDPATEIPPADLLPRRTRRATPYLYTSQEVAELMAAAARLRSPLLAATYETLIGLLAATGLFSSGQFGHTGLLGAFQQVSGRSAAGSCATRVVHVGRWVVSRAVWRG
jgi:integrase/recombinase XerD